MTQPTPAQRLEQVLCAPSGPAFPSPQLRAQAQRFAEGYKQFLNAAKTERETAAQAEQQLRAAGYVPFDPDKRYAPGDKVYRNFGGKALTAATIGSRRLEDGLHIVMAHGDSPRLDLKPNPLYEQDHFALLKTHYYGGVRKYQWTALPLALHGVVYRADGSAVTLRVGEEEGDPVFCITDLLPHVSMEQDGRTLKDGVRGEELNLLIGGTAVEDAGVQSRVKQYLLQLLHEKYGITERDFVRAELEAVPAAKARDVGFDRSMVGSYGQDDRVCVYPALQAEIAVRNPARTTLFLLCDKEEINSDGVTGMQSMFALHFIQQLCRAAGADDIRTVQNSLCLCADVTCAYDPNWPDAFDPRNTCRLGHGVALLKYSGEEAKYETSDASAELLSYVTRGMDQAGIPWQTGEFGRVDLGCSGTAAMYLVRQGIDTADIGVALLGMHSPCEVIHKQDLYDFYRTLKLFLAPDANHLWGE